MAPEATLPRSDVNVPSDYFSLAGFEVIMHGRFWVLTEAVADLEAKQYYLFGAGATRRSSALWNMRIDLAKETHIALDQNNAATAY